MNAGPPGPRNQRALSHAGKAYQCRTGCKHRCVLQSGEMTRPETPSAGPASKREIWTLLVLVAAAYAAQWVWQTHHDARQGRALAAAAGPGDLQMLASDTCAPCALARQWLRRHEVAFSECSIERDAACREQFVRLGAAGTPAFVVKGRQLVLGLDEARLLAALQAAPAGGR